MVERVFVCVSVQAKTPHAVTIQFTQAVLNLLTFYILISRGIFKICTCIKSNKNVLLDTCLSCCIMSKNNVLFYLKSGQIIPCLIHLLIIVHLLSLKEHICILKVRFHWDTFLMEKNLPLIISAILSPTTPKVSLT